LAAAKVGGIWANAARPAEFIFDNLQIQSNVIDLAWRAKVRKLLFLGSSCIYPKLAAQPMKEEYLLTGALEPTNEAYAVAKIAGLKMCQAYRAQYDFQAISLMPTNLYGPEDNFDLEDSHVIAAMVNKYVTAVANDEPKVVLWGTGSPSREFLYVDDAARALILAAEHADSSQPFNVGTGVETKIRDLAELVSAAAGFKGKTVWDTDRPDGQPTRYLDVNRAAELIGFSARTSLDQGLAETIASFRAAKNPA
jgi:GDP-L-fucose synthase